MPWLGTGPREVIRTYLLNYAPAQGTTSSVALSQVFQLWHHSFLSEIRMEGRCAQFEDSQGNTVENHECPGPRLPSTTFEYEDGYPVFGVAAFTKVEGGPPGAVDADRVLPYLNSIGVVDFNRDGLPDIVQGWNTTDCTGKDALTDTNKFPIKVSPNLDQLECSFKSEFGEVRRPFQSTRPIVGYLNRGMNSLNLNLSYQCMDTGRMDDVTGLTHYNASNPPAFFTNRGGVTLIGPWSEGVVAWNFALYAPYRAKPLTPGLPIGEFDPGSGCDADHFDESNFHPGWKWEQTQTNVDWAKLPIAEQDPSRQNLQTRWFADIDGDGLIDRLSDSGVLAFDFNVANVEFTRRYAKDEPRPGVGLNAAQIPFSWSPDIATSLAPSPHGRGDTRFYYADVNGDGFDDLITQNPNDDGGIPRVRPGDGQGHFWCESSQQPWTCREWPTWPTEPSSAYEIAVSGARTPWPFTGDTFFHDVTGDGLADIVQYDKASGEVRVWVNQDGHLFACITPSCVAGKVLDQRTSTFDIGDHRTTFADMNGDGIDDIVILTKHGAYVGVFMKKFVPVQGFERGSASKPGLLVRIHNGFGATTDIRYRTIQELDLAARGTPSAWHMHSPVVENVVTQIITQDDYHAGGDLGAPSVSAPYSFKRTAQYFYQDPAYDRWTRGFAGFRKVVAHVGDEDATTATTYWFGPCQNNGLNALDVPLCTDGSNDDDFKSLSGRVARIDRSNEFIGIFSPQRHVVGPKILWTKTFQYSGPAMLFDRPDGRVSFTYPAMIDTFLYDDALPTTPGDERTLVAGGDVIKGPAHQVGVRRHLSREVEYDDRGNLKRTTDKGAVTDEDSKLGDVADATTVTLISPSNPLDPNGPSGPDDAPSHLLCTVDWRCPSEFVSIWEPQPVLGGSNPAKLLRKSRFSFFPSGDVQMVEGWLDSPSASLDRHHPAGSVAPPPPGQSVTRGWHVLRNFDYDEFGNVTEIVSGQTPGSSPPNCTNILYDKVYRQLPNVLRSFKDGCGGSALETETVYDRGFEALAGSTSPSGSQSEFHYDQFGRPAEVFLPNPDLAGGGPATILAATLTYSDKKPLSHIDMRRIVGPGSSLRSVSFLNGLGEAVVGFDQSDSADWVLSGWREANTAGQLTKLRRPWTYAGDPVNTATNAIGLAIPADNSMLEATYDGFGRGLSVTEAGTGFSLVRTLNEYFPLAIETRDAEQLKTGGQHGKAYQRIELDGRGRSTRTVKHLGMPVAEDIVTTAAYAPTGELQSVTRTHAGTIYQRVMEFDMLGRLILNKEPNTGNNWRYVWDDSGRLVGSSDARGCGENLYYDGLSRVIGEDYSPCLASQPAYSTPNLATGEGLEVSYRYDTYEADQVSAEPGFADISKFALGKLVSVTDRGSRTRFNYDARDRMRRIARQIAKPSSNGTAPSYAPRWFASRVDYDQGDRIIRRTTGADVPELLMGGSSEERYNYSPRGLVSGIDSSYGTIIKSKTYNPDGAPTRIVYGDSRATAANFGYDIRHRLTLYQLIAPKGSFPLPIGHFDYRISNYDDVGNPLVIEDLRIAWQPLPAEAAPQEKRTMAYDDLYRLTRVDNSYKTRNGTAPWQSPFAAELMSGDRHPIPLRTLPTRIGQQTFTYDGLGNITSSSDDLGAMFDRSLGSGLGYGTQQNGPNQLKTGNGVQIQYDETGNLTEMKIRRDGICAAGAVSQCAQSFAYDWDEVGHLSRARRWDFDGNSFPSQTPGASVPTTSPSWDVSYAYSQGNRVRKSIAPADGAPARHTLTIFDTLRIDQADFKPSDGVYDTSRENMHVYVGATAHAFWDAGGSLPHQAPGSAVTMHMVVGDHVGSSTVMINHATSEEVERTTYQPYGAVESDYRPPSWKSFREPYKFTGKEEDIEVGVGYFGARYYAPSLGRFMSPDPLTIHGLGSDLNPYAYVGGRVMSFVDPFGLCPEAGTRSNDGGTSTVTTSGDCPEADAKAAHGEALATQAGVRQPGPIQREWAVGAQSWIPTPPDPEPDFETVGADASSAGGVPTNVNPNKTVTYKSSAREILAKQYPPLAPRIAAAERQDAFLEYAHLLLLLVPGAQSEGLLAETVGVGGRAAVPQISFGAGAASPAEFVSKVINSGMPHAAERAVERAGFSTTTEARVALQNFGIELKGQGVLPEGAIFDTHYGDRVIIPGFGNGGGGRVSGQSRRSLQAKNSA